MDLLLKVWRQKDKKAKGKMEDYKVSGISEDSSFRNVRYIKQQSYLRGQRTHFI